MNYIQLLSEDLEKGYSKSDLEKLIGLPKNNLSGILKGDRELSKKSKLKIQQWQLSEKPNPLDLRFVKPEIKIQDASQPTNVVEPKKPLGSEKTNYTVNTITAKPEAETKLTDFQKYQRAKLGLK